MSTHLVPRLVKLSKPSDLELTVYLVLDRKTTRQNQKLKTLNQYVQQYPSGWKKRLELANLLYEIGEWEQAVKEYRQVLERQPQDVHIGLKLGKILQVIARKEEAISIYQKILSVCQSEINQRHIEGLLAICKGNRSAAIEAFTAAASLEPDNKVHWLAAGQVHSETENALAALEIYEKILSDQPDNLVALISSYDELIAVGELGKAEQKLSRAIDVSSQDFRVLKRQIDRSLRKRLVSSDAGKQTRKLISVALKLAPQTADSHHSLAYYYIFRGEPKKGVQILQEFTQEHQKNPSSWYYYARCLFHTGNHGEAAAAILQAYQLYPQDCEINRTLCEILSVAGQLKQLRPLLEEMLDRFPHHWSIRATVGQVLVEHYQAIERGCDLSLQATHFQPQLAATWFHHGRVLALAGRPQAAVAALATGWQLLPDTGGNLHAVSAATCLAESYAGSEDPESRIQNPESTDCSQSWWQETYRRAEGLMNFDPAMACYWQGKALEELGTWKDAIDAYNKALDWQLLNPALGEVEATLKRLKAMARKGSSA